jgi:hypothetical protein
MIEPLDPRGFNFSKSANLPPIDITNPLTVLHTTVSCGSTSASVDITVLPNIHITVSVDAAVSGTIIPPHIDDMNIITGTHYLLVAFMRIHDHIRTGW